jgi:hypothetical protein
MHSNWLYDQGALWIIVLLLAAMILAAELAYRLGRRRHARTKDAERDAFVAIKVSLLGLLALLLAFTFSMAADRYTERQRLVLDEANVLHTLLLRASLLSESARARFQPLFRKFLDTRLEFFEVRRDLAALERAIERTEELHRQMWELARAEALVEPPAKGADGMLQALTEEWTIHRRRVHAFEDRVPDAVVLLLFGGTIISMAAVGFAAGYANDRGTVGRVLLGMLLAGTILVVLDLDRPRRGIFQISQEPLLHLKELLDHEPGASRSP